MKIEKFRVLPKITEKKNEILEIGFNFFGLKNCHIINNLINNNNINKYHIRRTVNIVTSNIEHSNETFFLNTSLNSMQKD